jgi:hypothetical protein
MATMAVSRKKTAPGGILIGIGSISDLTQLHSGKSPFFQIFPTFLSFIDISGPRSDVSTLC